MSRRLSVMALAAVALVVATLPLSADEIGVAKFDGSDVALTANPLSGVPEYQWYYGCSPTSAGMLVGYYDSHPSGAWDELVAGDVSTWNQTAKDMVASPEHIGDYWGTPDPNPGGHLDNCLADFMHTSRSAEGLSDGGTAKSMLAQGLAAFTQCDNSSTA